MKNCPGIEVHAREQEREWVSEDVRSEPTLIPQHQVVIQGAKLLGFFSPSFFPPKRDKSSILTKEEH